jgi:hypothetical protein
VRGGSRQRCGGSSRAVVSRLLRWVPGGRALDVTGQHALWARWADRVSLPASVTPGLCTPISSASSATEPEVSGDWSHRVDGSGKPCSPDPAFSGPRIRRPA